MKARAEIPAEIIDYINSHYPDYNWIAKDELDSISIFKNKPIVNETFNIFIDPVLYRAGEMYSIHLFSQKFLFYRDKLNNAFNNVGWLQSVTHL